MAKDDKQTLTPRLRFPEFRAAWEKVPLKDLADAVSDRVGTTPCTPYTVTSGVGLVSQAEKFGRTIAGNSLKNYIRLQKNDFAYNKSATKAFPEGYITRYLDDAKAAVPNSIFTCFRVDERKIDPAYLDFLFAGNLHGRWLRKFLTIGARAHGSLNVSDGDLMALPVPMPSGTSSFAEQQKIADCLTSLDELIAAQARKVEALKAHKKGLMQQLFPREGETLPRLRFPEFRHGPQWETRELGAMTSKVGSGITPLGGEKNYKTQGRPFVRSQNVGWGGLILDDVAYIDEDTHRTFDATEIQVSDVLLNITGASIGRSAVADWRIVGGYPTRQSRGEPATSGGRTLSTPADRADEVGILEADHRRAIAEARSRAGRTGNTQGGAGPTVVEPGQAIRRLYDQGEDLACGSEDRTFTGAASIPCRATPAC